MTKRLTLTIKSNNYVPDMRSWIIKNKLDIKLSGVIVDPSTFEPSIRVSVPDGADTTAFLLKWG